MAKQGQLMTLKEASKKTGIKLSKLYYIKNDAEKMKKHGLKLVVVGGINLVANCA